MEIQVREKRLREALQDERACRRLFGAPMAKKIQLRIGALRAADSLGDFWPPKSGPERCHELTGDMAGSFSIDVKQPYRLIFRPIESSEKVHETEQERWQSIKSIELLGVEDTHG